MKKFLILVTALVVSGAAFAQTGQMQDKSEYRYTKSKYGIIRQRAMPTCNTRACIIERGKLYRAQNRGIRVNLDFDSTEAEFMH